MGIGANIRALREKYGLTQDQLAEKLGVTRESVHRWETDKMTVRDRHISKLIELFGIEPEDIKSERYGLAAQLSGRASGLPANAIPVRPSTATAPLLGWVHAGSPEDERVLDDSVEMPSSVLSGHPNGFFLRVEGDCMNRQFPEGCYVFVDPDAAPWNGCAVAAELPGYEGVLRSYFRGQSSLMLCADSFGEYEDIILTGEDPVRLIGVVVWFQADRELEG